MIKLDENLLVELGLGALPKEEKTEFLKHMYSRLELNVGTRLAERMSDAQMTEFEQFITSNNEQGAFQWLEGNFPDYKDVVAEEFEKLKAEIRPLASQIVTASAHSGAQPQLSAQPTEPPSGAGQYGQVSDSPPQSNPFPAAPPAAGYRSDPVQPAYSPAGSFQPGNQPTLTGHPGVQPSQPAAGNGSDFMAQPAHIQPQPGVPPYASYGQQSPVQPALQQPQQPSPYDYHQPVQPVAGGGQHPPAYQQPHQPPQPQAADQMQADQLYQNYQPQPPTGPQPYTPVPPPAAAPGQQPTYQPFQPQAVPPPIQQPPQTPPYS